jgi:hypothetical protein
MPKRCLLLVLRFAITVAILGASAGCGGISVGVNEGKPSIPTPTGFPGDNTQVPMPGSWLAIGRTTSSVGYGNIYVGREIKRWWRIARLCTRAGACSFTLTREVNHARPISSPLIDRSDGWHATFPMRRYPCGETPSGITTYWMEAFIMVVRFTDGGSRAEAHERTYSESPACGYGTATNSWLAFAAKRSRAKRELLSQRSARR